MDQAIVLGRAGHYFVPTSSADEPLTGSCQAATIAHVWHGADDQPSAVNLSVLEQSGRPFERTSVVIGVPVVGSASFHLNRDCPWTR